MALNFGKSLNSQIPAKTVAPAPAPAPAQPKNIFSGIEAAKASFGANYVRAGHYLMVIRNAKRLRTRKGEDAVIFEMTCAHVLNDLGNPDPHREGEECTHFLKASSDSFLGNLKSAICNIGNCTEADVTVEALDSIIVNGADEISPLAGLCVEVVAMGIVTKAGKDFTRIDYKRQIAPSELAGFISAKTADLIFGRGGLEKLVADEQAAG